MDAKYFYVKAARCFRLHLATVVGFAANAYYQTKYVLYAFTTANDEKKRPKISNRKAPLAQWFRVLVL